VETAAETAAEDLTPAREGLADVAWDGPTRAGEEGEIAELAAESARVEAEPEAEVVLDDAPALEGEPTLEAEAALGGEPTLEAAATADDAELPPPAVETAGRLESILESLLYAADRPLTVGELKRLVTERDTKKVTAALEALRERHADTGIQLASP